MNVVAIGDPFCGWFCVVFCYMLGSGTLQFPHIFDEIQVRACSNFDHFGALSPLPDSVLYIERVRSSIFLHTLNLSTIRKTN